MADQSFAAFARETTGCRDPIDMLLKAASIERYHTESDVPGQTVGQHTFRLICVMMDIWPGCSRDLILAAQYHDVTEVFSGDIPAPILWYSNEFKAMVNQMQRRFADEVLRLPRFVLTNSEIARMKCADYLELSDYCSQFNTPGAKRIMRNGILAVGRYSESLNHDDGFALAEWLRSAQSRDKYRNSSIRQDVIGIALKLEAKQYTE